MLLLAVLLDLGFQIVHLFDQFHKLRIAFYAVTFSRDQINYYVIPCHVHGCRYVVELIVSLLIEPK